MTDQEIEKYLDSILDRKFKYEREKIFADWRNKERVSQGILKDFEKRVGQVKDKNVLDLGYGNGVTAIVFAQAGAKMSGLDVTENLHNFALKTFADRNIEANLQLYDGLNFPLSDNSFDYIYSVSVLEHTSHPKEFLAEAYRVLKPGGKFYLAFPNRIYPKETHSGIYFASYLPRLLADWYLKLFGRSGVDMYWNVHFLSYFKLKRFLKGTPFKIIMEDKEGTGFKKIFKKILAKFGIHHSALLPHIMVILEKE